MQVTWKGGTGASPEEESKECEGAAEERHYNSSGKPGEGEFLRKSKRMKQVGRKKVGDGWKEGALGFGFCTTNIKKIEAELSLSWASNWLYGLQASGSSKPSSLLYFLAFLILVARNPMCLVSATRGRISLIGHLFPHREILCLP
jgi:hypothetical protein